MPPRSRSNNTPKQSSDQPREEEDWNHTSISKTFMSRGPKIDMRSFELAMTKFCSMCTKYQTRLRRDGFVFNSNDIDASIAQPLCSLCELLKDSAPESILTAKETLFREGKEFIFCTDLEAKLPGLMVANLRFQRVSGMSQSLPLLLLPLKLMTPINRWMVPVPCKARKCGRYEHRLRSSFHAKLLLVSKVPQ